MNELIKNQPLQTIVDNYNVACNEISRAFHLLESARGRLTSCFGENFYIINHDIRDYDIRNSSKISSKTICYIKKEAWRYIAKKMQVKDLMTEKRSQQFDKQLEDGCFPDLTVENVIGLYEQFSSNINSYLEESAKEVFEYLRPHDSKHKTNTEYEIGKRAIITCCFQYGGYVSSYYDHKITSIDNVFHLLDGKGTAKYPDDLLSRINSVSQGKTPPNNKLETEYFKLKWYFRSDTLHFEFLRKDLLDKLNAIGGGNRLKNT